MPQAYWYGKLTTWARRYGWVAYWPVFVAYTLDAARDPGFVMDPEAAPYPWTAALQTCALLGAQTAALNATLRPMRSRPSWRRVAVASGLALGFAVLSLAKVAMAFAGSARMRLRRRSTVE